MTVPFSATIEREEAVLRFPYDERLRLLLRAIPGRRWDPERRAWCVPLGPEQAYSLASLIDGLPGRPHVSDELARAIKRGLRRRQARECLVDLARPDQDWWLSFSTDAPSQAVHVLLGHPRARELPAIGRALLPFDDRAVGMLAQLRACDAERDEFQVELSPATRRALQERAERASLEWERTRDVRARAPTRARAGRSVGDDVAIRPAPPATLVLSDRQGKPTFVLVPGRRAGLLAEFARLPGALRPSSRRPPGSDGLRLPAIRADPFCVPELDRFLREGAVHVEPAALAALQEIREQHARAAGLVALSMAQDAHLQAELPAGLARELKPFQRAGVSYLLERRRAFLADEQGLGKTIEALAAIEAADAYPAVVICPASLKLNWLREIDRWLPDRAARALAGTGGQGPAGAEITVANYEILARRLPELSALRARALVIDESHYCKNPSAKRTQAVARLASSVRDGGLVLALSGTPVTNRPTELVPQLRILGRLEEFGSAARFGERFRGPDAHVRLHWHLRARCLVRRRKRDVLPQLPAKTRAIVPVELDNEAEYRLAERDVVAWLASQPLDLRELDAKVASALRAERLVRLNALKLLAARGKLRAALTWAHDFCSSGERLVVFARHREIQLALRARFPHALHILGGDSPASRDRAVACFQEPDSRENQLIVCSLEVAAQGLTLTRASNVAFLELDWTPAKHDQAEDRCHRIGQQDAVTAYYLLAADTVDESIAKLLERKRAVIAAVTDGREQDEETILDALVRELRATPYRHLRAVA